MNRQKWTILTSAAGMLMLILDSRTALSGAKEGIEICIQTLIPSLFPFIVLSGLMAGTIAEVSFRWMRLLERWFRIPMGSGHLLILGFLAGYPVGAKNVADAYRNGQLTLPQVQRLSALCNNAGPAFLFGVLTSQFTNIRTVFYLWLIQILGVFLTSRLMAEEKPCIGSPDFSTPITPVQALEQALSAMASVCGWVILFRVLLGFIFQYCAVLIPAEVLVLISGLLELSNGCLMLQSLPAEGLRFSLSSVFLSFGGCCVLMQTGSVCKHLSMKTYIKMKSVQVLICYSLSLAFQFIFSAQDRITHPIFLLPLLFLPIICRRDKKRSSIPASIGV